MNHKLLDQLLHTIEAFISNLPHIIHERCYKKKRDSYQWIRATDNFIVYEFIEHHTSIPAILKEDAHVTYDQWVVQQSDLKYRSTIISNPECSISTLHFLQKLSQDLVSKDHHPKWTESLDSFVQFLRMQCPSSQIGHINELFPETKGVRDGVIFRLERAKAFPIDILAISKILKALTLNALKSSSRMRRSAHETLALAYLCVSYSWSRVPIREQQVLQVRYAENNTIPPSSCMFNTLFGDIPIQLPGMLHECLRSLYDPQTKRFFVTTLRNLQKHFKATIEPLNLEDSLGEITIRTLLSQSHEALGHRYRP